MKLKQTHKILFLEQKDTLHKPPCHKANNNKGHFMG